jgi:type I restriction enzyme S subunit
MTNYKNIPALRFKEFEGEDSYKEYLFKDIFLFSTGKNIKQKEASPEFEIPCVRYGELYHMYNEVIYKTINKTNLDSSELKFSKGNEILLPSAGEDPLDIGSASALTIENVAIGRTINILRPANDNVYIQIYVSYYINQQLKKKIATLAKGSSISNVYNSDLKTLKINLPTKPEQQKIANFLTTIDTKIQQLRQKQELLENYKKGVMQQIFKQEIRFKDDDGGEFEDWEVKRLGELTNKVGKKNKDSIQYPIYSINNKEGFLPQSDQFDGLDSNDRGYDISLYKIVYKNTFAYNPARINVGSIGYSGELENVIVSSLYICFETKSELDDNYLLQYLTTFDFNKSVIRNSEGGVRMYLFYGNFSGIKIPLPSIGEQQKIANFLSGIDKRIASVKEQIGAMEDYKKGLLQGMFV